MAQSNHPWGTTHVILPDPLAYTQRPEFVKFALEFIGPESGEPFYCWYIWHSYKYSKDWAKDTATLYSSLKAKGRLITIAEYLAQNSLQKSES